MRNKGYIGLGKCLLRSGSIIFLFVFAFPFAACFAKVWTLNEALKELEVKGLKSQEASSRDELAKAKQRNLLGEWLPTLTAEWHLTEQKLRVEELGYDPYSTLGSQKIHQEGYSIILKEALDAPWSWAKRWKLLQLNNRIDEINKNSAKEQEQLELRRLFVNLAHYKKMYELDRELLDKWTTVFNLIEARYKNGQISEPEFLQASLQQQKLREGILESRISFASTMRKIHILIGDFSVLPCESVVDCGPLSQDADSMGGLRPGLERLSQDLEKNGLADVLETRRETVSLDMARLHAEIADEEAALRRLEFLPKVSLGFSYDYAVHNSTPVWDYVRPEGPKMELILSWDLFSGGRSYYEYKTYALQAREKNRILERGRLSDPLLRKEHGEELQLALEKVKGADLELKVSHHIYLNGLDFYRLGRKPLTEVYENFQSARAAHERKFAATQKLFSSLSILVEEGYSLQFLVN